MQKKCIKLIQRHLVTKTIPLKRILSGIWQATLVCQFVHAAKHVRWAFSRVEW